MKIESLQDRCLEALRRVDHTLAVHGKVDAESDLHKLIQDILYPGAPNEDPSGQRREAMLPDEIDDEKPFKSSSIGQTFEEVHQRLAGWQDSGGDF